VVAVYVNIGAEPRTVQLDFALGSRRWRLMSITPYITSDREGDELKAYPAAPAGVPIEIPARSLVTLEAQFT
jgi:hypothetical protein